MYAPEARNMKKITAMTLLLAMALSVASCGGGNGRH